MGIQQTKNERRECKTEIWRRASKTGNVFNRGMSDGNSAKCRAETGAKNMWLVLSCFCMFCTYIIIHILYVYIYIYMNIYIYILYIHIYIVEVVRSMKEPNDSPHNCQSAGNGTGPPTGASKIPSQKSDLIWSVLKNVENERQIYRNIRPFAMGPEWRRVWLLVLRIFFRAEDLGKFESRRSRTRQGHEQIVGAGWFSTVVSLLWCWD